MNHWKTLLGLDISLLWLHDFWQCCNFNMKKRQRSEQQDRKHEYHRKVMLLCA